MGIRRLEVLNRRTWRKNQLATKHSDTDASVDTARNGDIVGERYILGQDTFQLELLTNLDQLPTRGAVIYAISPKPKDAPGFPVRAFAIKP